MPNIVLLSDSEYSMIKQEKLIWTLFQGVVLNIWKCPTWTGRDVTLLKLLRRAQAGLTSVPRLWAAAGPLSAPNASAAVSATLRPGAPGGPATIHSVARDSPQTKNFTCEAQRFVQG